MSDLNAPSKRARLPWVIAFAALVGWGAAAHGQERVGIVGDRDVERQTVTIDGRAYRVTPETALSYAQEADRFLAVRVLTPGMTVRYTPARRIRGDGPAVLEELVIVEE